MLLSMVTFGLGLARLAHSATVDLGHGFSIRDSLPEGYVESQITWSGFEEIGVETELKGTLESILEKMPRNKEALRMAAEPVGNVSQVSINQAGDLPPSNHMMIKCMDEGLNFARAKVSKIQDGIAYLSGMSDTQMCGNDAAVSGQGKCGRISCSYDAGIWWCNDNPHYVAYPCRVFASFAQTIIDTVGCYDTNQGYKNYAKGQYFDLDYGINVIVGAPKDDC